MALVMDVAASKSLPYQYHINNRYTNKFNFDFSLVLSDLHTYPVSLHIPALALRFFAPLSASGAAVGE
jgi:hypothetical protein